jgi:ComF family protein
MNWLKKIFKEFFNPRFCVICKNWAEGWVCRRCKKLESKAGWFSFNNRVAFSIYFYNTVSQKILLEIKYNRNIFLIKESGRVLANELNEYIIKNQIKKEDCVIVSVASYWARVLRKGYSPVGLLSSYISQYTNIEYLQKAIVKKHNRLQKNTQNTQDRFINASSGFVLNSTINHSNVILVDDMITSGATVSACVELLENKNVIILAVGCSESFRKHLFLDIEDIS